MARLIYSAIASLDGYVEDEQGTFDWAAPDEEVLAAVNDLERPIGTYLYGRRMYDEPMSIGRLPAPALISRPGYGTSPSSGGSPRRSTTPGPRPRALFGGERASRASPESPLGSRGFRRRDAASA